jgi:oligosaccharyltransferase complex subunit epsilon
VSSIIEAVKASYTSSISTRIKLLDLLITTLLVLTAIQVCYVVVSRSSFPFNSVLSGLFASLGSAVIAIGLRIQLTNPSEFSDIKPERAFADFLVAIAVLNIAVFNFLG